MSRPGSSLGLAANSQRGGPAALDVALSVRAVRDSAVRSAAECACIRAAGHSPAALQASESEGALVTAAIAVAHGPRRPPDGRQMAGWRPRRVGTASRDPGPAGPSQRAVSTVVEKEKPDDEERDRDSEEPEKTVFHGSFPSR